MGVTVGDIVILTVTEVAGYACWGTSRGQTGFVHCHEWSWDRPIPDRDIPAVGAEIAVKVFHVTDRPQGDLSTDVTYDGKFQVDFAGSVKLLRPQPKDARS